MKQPSWSKLFARQSKTVARALQPLREQRKPPTGAGDWLAGMVVDASGLHRYWLFRPAGVRFGERLPLVVMLHGCHQDAKSFAASTRMNTIAARERFLVLYPEQARMANGQRCWNWFDTQSGRGHGEAAWILHAIDKVCVQYTADRGRVAIAGLSAGAGMAALVATRYPGRLQAVAMHSGVPPGVADSTLSAIGAMRGRAACRVLQAPVPSASPAPPWPPLMVIHGDRDAVVSPTNARTAAQMWSEATGGAREAAPRTLQRGQRHPMQVTEFKRSGRLVCSLVQIAQLGHAWSGGAAGERFSDAKGPDASRMVWAFAAKCFAAAPAATAAVALRQA